MGVVPTTIVLASAEEATKIWNHILTATALCVGTLEAYAQLGLLGSSSEALTALSGRLLALTHGESKG